MSVIAVGAIAAALAVSSAVLAPFARLEPAILRVAHPDRRALDDANWRRPIWHWESLRASCILGGALLSLATPLPPVLLAAAGGLAPSVVVRSRAGAMRSRARLATAHLLRATEAGLRSGASLPEALRRACGAASEHPIARRPFVDALRAFDLGAPLDTALRDSAVRATDQPSRIALETLAMEIGRAHV